MNNSFFTRRIRSLLYEDVSTLMATSTIERGGERGERGERASNIEAGTSSNDERRVRNENRYAFLPIRSNEMGDRMEFVCMIS